MTKRERNGLIVRLELYSIKCILLFESFVKIAANRHFNFFRCCCLYFSFSPNGANH